MDLEKFTDRTKGFLQAAQTIALRETHQQVTPEHLLKALLDDPEGMAASLIAAAGGDIEKARAGTDMEVGKLPRVEGASSMYWAQQTTRVLDQAEQLAKNRARQQGEPVEERARPSVTRPTRTESPTPASTAIGGRVSDLVVSRGEGGALSIDLSGKGDFAKYRDLDLGDRLVVDLEGPWTLGSRVQSRYAVDHGSVRSVRLGLHSGYLRLVFDLTEGARPSIGLENGVDGLTIRIGGP